MTRTEFYSIRRMCRYWIHYEYGCNWARLCEYAGGMSIEELGRIIYTIKGVDR